MSTKPTIIPTTLSQISDNKQIWGGKATSLYRLRSLGVRVPDAWVIPCKHSVDASTVEQIDLSGVFNSSDSKYSVRSGAPISMPGLLKTKLHVAHKDLHAAIQDVWDSWNSPHAIEYRKNKEIPDDIGTAVIIQRMVDARFSGVAFTNRPDNFSNLKEFKPLAEYIKIDGKTSIDALVSGEATPKKLNFDAPYTYDMGKINYYTGSLLGGLRLIHEAWGPSDVEWSIDNNGYLWFLQQRPMKFAVKQKTTVVNGRTCLFKGKPIGAPVAAVGRFVVLSGGLEFKPGDVAYVDAFASEYYPMMVKASAIITATGGETCHASIIARDLERPALSGMFDASELEGKLVMVDGDTGAIYTPTQDEIEKHSGTVQVTAKLDPERIPDLTITDRETPLEVVNLLYRFYYNFDQRNTGKITQERFNEISKEIAKIFATYFFLACAGEARHYAKTINWSTKKTTDVVLKLRSRGFAMAEYSEGRSTFCAKIKQPQSIEEAIETMELVDYIHGELEWPSGGYGGNKWSQITRNLLVYLKGEVTDALFIDACFNLQHNGGRAFDKFGWITCKENQLKELLDLKQQASDVSKLREKILTFAVGRWIFKPTVVDEYATAPQILTADIVNPAKKAEQELKEKLDKIKGQYDATKNQYVVGTVTITFTPQVEKPAKQTAAETLAKAQAEIAAALNEVKKKSKVGANAKQKKEEENEAYKIPTGSGKETGNVVAA